MSTQLDIKQKKLIAIALGVTEHLLYRESKLSSCSQIGDYQVWRDRNNIALVNAKTHKLIVFGEIVARSKKQFSIQNIVHRALWKELKLYDAQISFTTATEEIESAWLFFRPLDPTIQSLYQIQPLKTKQRRLSIASQNTVRKLTRTISDWRYSSRSKSSIDSIL